MKRISTDTYMLMQKDIFVTILEMNAGKGHPDMAKKIVDGMLEVNECEVVDVVPDTPEIRQKELQSKLSI